MRSDTGGKHYGAAKRAYKMEGMATEDKENTKTIVDTDDGDIEDEDFGDP